MRDISKDAALKIIKSREELEGFRKPQTIAKLSEFSPFEWEEWKEQGITITID